jgi:FkbM family methyltransferase
MTKVNFNNRKVDFYIISSFVKKNNLNHSSVLEQAFQQEALIDDNKNLLSNFISSIKNKNDIKSQLYQDVFASFVVGNKFDKTFFEFGATNGIDLSNSYMLENSLNWKGALSEPSPQWHNELKKNRPNANIITDCLWSESNKELDFFVSEVGVLSSLNEFKENDKISMPGNTRVRLKNGKIISVNTISLNHAVENAFKFKTPSYISIDTEGSEYEILKVFDFKRFRPIVFTVEHNFTELELKIDDLMKSNNYLRVFKKITSFDAWYISKEAFDLLDK